MADVYDVIIVGAGPAGSTAALAARRHKLAVLLIERATLPRPAAGLVWVGPAALQLCQTCGATAESFGGAAFSGLRLLSWDLKRQVQVAERELRGRLVDKAAFDQVLQNLAVAGGAELRHGVVPTAVTLGEDRAVLRLSTGPEVRGRVVLIADGGESPTARLLNLPAATHVAEPGWCAHLTAEGNASAPGLDVVIGAGRRGQLATLARSGDQVRLSLLTRDESTPAAAQCEAFRRSAEQAGLFPPGPHDTLLVTRSVGGAALDLDTHVAKRCLLIGDAGGFVAAFSNEGLYPAMKSGWIAAETAARALRAPVVQDELATFSAAWRSDLADYLRMPNTDLSLLLPLVFSNAQMSARVARAFLLGQKFG